MYILKRRKGGEEPPAMQPTYLLPPLGGKKRLQEEDINYIVISLSCPLSHVCLWPCVTIK